MVTGVLGRPRSTLVTSALSLRDTSMESTFRILSPALIPARAAGLFSIGAETYVELSRSIR